MNIKQNYEARTYLLDPSNIALIESLAREEYTSTTLVLDTILDEWRDYQTSSHIKLDVSKKKLKAIEGKIDVVDEKLEMLLDKLDKYKV